MIFIKLILSITDFSKNLYLLRFVKKEGYMKLNVDAHLWCLGTYAERYVPGGYYDDMTLDEKLEIMSKINGLTGNFTFYPTEPLPNNPDKLVKKLEDYNLVVSNIAASTTLG